MQFMAELEPTEDGSLQIMYGVDGRRDLTESLREDLSGYQVARPVRIGNAAHDQHQNDVFGAALDSILLQTRRSQRLPRRLWPLVQSQGECATKIWKRPVQGIWEARGDPKQYVSSKLMCWIALDRPPVSPRSAATTISTNGGAPRPRTSAPTFSPTASAMPASMGTTARTRSNHQPARPTLTRR